MLHFSIYGVPVYKSIPFIDIQMDLKLHRYRVHCLGDINKDINESFKYK